MSLKRILIDATGIVIKPTGVGTYSYHILEALAESAHSPFGFTVLHQANLPRSHQLFSLRNERIDFLSTDTDVVGPKRDLTLFKLRNIVNRYALLHCLHTYLPAFGTKIPSIVTAHDLKFLLFPHFFTNYMKFLYYRWIIRRSMRSATQIVAVSEATKRDIIELTNTPSEKITVIHEASTISPSDMAAKGELPDVLVGLPYILFVGRNRVSKNIPRIIKAHKAARSRLMSKCPPLVIAGPDFEKVRYKYRGLTSSGNLILLGSVSKNELVTLYKNAVALVYPSLYEGFGLPILEAMSMGVPVITSNCSSMPEVAGDAAILVDPKSVGQISGPVVKVIQDKDEKDCLRKKGLNRAREFSWKIAAAKTLELYGKTLAV